ncbi:MAG: MBL fold metallo-hydrolase [Gemmatimonadetes bacterium]|nr:MBL fold metallo-hydrolase [Gemmatimonadota bacterium]
MSRATSRSLLVFVLACAGAACGSRQNEASGGAGASETTRAANAQMAASLSLNDPQDFDDAKRGLIARPTGTIIGPDGAVIVDFDAFKFEDGPAPATVNPSLWRHAQLNAQIGLFKVTDGIYQLRGFDLANMTLIDGKSGWIVVDPLTSSETAAAALAFARTHLSNKPVSAVIFTHSHIDHFGGVLGVLSVADAKARQVPVVAPDGFVQEATSENVLVGTSMLRRARYQFGRNIALSPTGLVDAGLGKTATSGSFGILMPTEIVSAPTQEMVLDGVRFVFHNVPGAEAPAELTFSVPERKAYCSAENVVQTMHNLLPIRGAKARDALRWSNYLDQALEHTASADVLFASHNWPVWGAARITALITGQRDVYKYTHDQTVRLLNAGFTPREIAEQVKLPASLQREFGSRGYYGDLRHNVKAVYQFYVGAYDGNPANLNPLPPEESAKRYVELMGGADKAVAAAQMSFSKGDYRWAAELLNQVVFAQPSHTGAKALLAQCYEQMAYAAESATWRNTYLVGAAELREGPPTKGVDRSAMIELLSQTPVERFLEAMAAGLNGPAAEGKTLKVNLVLTDTKESFVLWIENAVLHFRKAPPAADANATLTLTKGIFVKMMAGTAGFKDTLMSDQLKVAGSKVDVIRFFMLIDKSPGTFAIVTP